MDAMVLGRRLDRLRNTPSQSVAAPRAPSNHVAALAAELTGRVTRVTSGSVVTLDHRVRLPVDRDALAALPYGVQADKPLICIDLETTGLATAAGTLAFLVGLGSWSGDELAVTQLLLADHADERALLDVLAELIPADAWLVTYNGRCFDWPLIVARYRLHGTPPPATAGHLDLLPISRQLWKHRLGSARLATVEAEICGVRRTNDLPGALVPDRYFSYLRSRRAGLLRDVVEHNRQDIVSLALLVRRLSSGSLEGFEPGDLFGLARAYARRGQPEAALGVVEHALRAENWTVRQPAAASMHTRLSAEHARLLAHVGRRDEALVAWLEIARRGGPGAAPALLHVARHREHVERDVVAALAACNEAASVAGRARAWGDPMFAVERDLQRRLPRLTRKVFAGRYARRAEPRLSSAA